MTTTQKPLVTEATPTTFEDVTVYISGAFGFHGTHCKRADVREGRWAQYDNAVMVSMLEPRKRKATGTIKASREVVIVAGKGPKDPIPMFLPAVTEGDVTVRTSAAACFDKSWGERFAAWLPTSGLKVLADFRTPATAAEVA